MLRMARVSVNVDFLDDLEDESLRLTGNWEEEESDQNGRCRRRCWNPSGRIRVRERSSNRDKSWLPVKYVKVRARRWFTVRTDFTDANGNFHIPAFKRRKSQL